MDISVGFTELRNNLATMLDETRVGNKVLIKRHGKVIAALVPVDKAHKKSWQNKVEPVKLRGEQIDATIQKLRE